MRPSHFFDHEFDPARHLCLNRISTRARLRWRFHRGRHRGRVELREFFFMWSRMVFAKVGCEMQVSAAVCTVRTWSSDTVPCPLDSGTRLPWRGCHMHYPTWRPGQTHGLEDTGACGSAKRSRGTVTGATLPASTSPTYKRRPGQPSSSSLARRVCVHIVYAFTDALSCAMAPGPH